MHDTAMEYGRQFFTAYTKNRKNLTIVDIGAQDFNGSLRSAAPANHRYVGVDSEKGKGVDIVNEDPYEKGWLVKLKVADPAAVQGLLDAAAYRQLIGE